MEPAKIAIIVSFLSLIVAGISLYWLIKREFLKPKVKVDFELFIPTSGSGIVVTNQKLVISGTNMGPNEVRLTGIYLKPKGVWFKRKLKKGVFFDWITRLNGHNSDVQLPCTLQVGERKEFNLKYNQDCFLKEDKFVSIGFFDSFGKWHCVSKKQYKKVREQFKKESW